MKKRMISSWLCVIILSPQVYAEVEFNGFMTASGGQIIDDDELSGYEGYDNKFNTSPDTKYGLQVQSDITDKLSGAAQLLSKGIDTYNTELEWVYISYDLSPYWMVRTGRLKSPFFMYSDYLDVGYAYPWIRPPSQTYLDTRFSAFQGVDTVFEKSIGNWETTFQAHIGRVQDTIETPIGSVDRDVDFMAGVNFTAVYNYMLTLNATYRSARFAATSPLLLQNLIDGLNSIVPPAPPAAAAANAADAIKVENEHAHFYSLAAVLELEKWLLIGEITAFDVEEQSTLEDHNSYYLTLGYRLGPSLIHLTYNYGEEKTDYAMVNGLPLGLQTGLYNAIGPETEREDITLGTRFDVMTNTAFKVELTHFAFKTIENQATAGSDLSGLLLSASVDVVF